MAMADIGRFYLDNTQTYTDLKVDNFSEINESQNRFFEPKNMACTWNGKPGSCTAWPCDACAARKRGVSAWSPDVIPITGNPPPAFVDEDICFEVVARDTRTSGADATADAIDNVEMVNTLSFRRPEDSPNPDIWFEAFGRHTGTSSTSGADATADAIDNVELVNTLLFRCPDDMAAEDLTDKGRALLEALASRYGIPGGAELMQNLERIRKAHVAYAFDSEDDDMPGLE